MTRKSLFLLAVASSAASHLYFRTASEGVMGFISHCVFMGFMMPGNVASLLLERIAPLPFHSYIAVTSLISALVWFFPLNRVRRIFGVYDAFTGGKRSRYSPLRALAHAIEEVNKRLFGRKKTAGWG